MNILDPAFTVHAGKNKKKSTKKTPVLVSSPTISSDTKQVFVPITTKPLFPALVITISSTSTGDNTELSALVSTPPPPPTTTTTTTEGY